MKRQRPGLRKVEPLPPLASPERRGIFGIIHPLCDVDCAECKAPIAAASTAFSKHKMVGGVTLVFCAKCIKPHIEADKRRAAEYVAADTDGKKTLHALVMHEEYGIRGKSR